LGGIGRFVRNHWKMILVVTATIAVGVVVGVATGGLGDAAALAILGADASPLAAGAISGMVVGGLSGGATSATYQTGIDLAKGKRPGVDVAEATALGVGLGVVTGPLIPAGARLLGVKPVVGAVEEAAAQDGVNGVKRAVAVVVTQLPYRQGLLVALEQMDENEKEKKRAAAEGR